MAINARQVRAEGTKVARVRDRLARFGEAGFSMVEVMVSLLIVAIVTTAAVAFIIGGLRGQSAQKERQQAIFVADQQMEKIKALPTSEISLTNGSSALVEGRTLSKVQALWATAAANDLKIPQQDDETSQYDYDPQGTANTLAVDTMPVVKVNGLTYQLYNFIDVCWLNQTTQTCGTSQIPGTTFDYRATVDVTWTSSSCSTGCNYSDSTIIDPALDPTFNTNISTPTGAVTATSNADSTLPQLAVSNPQMLYNDAGADPNGNSCKTNPAGSSYPGTMVTVTGTGFLSGMTADLSGTTRDAGTIAAGSLYQPSATVVEFCIATGDQPNSYTVTLINTDKGHFPLTITEVPAIFAAGGWNADGKQLTMTTGGLETGATVTATTSNGGTASWSGSPGLTVPPTTDTSPATSAVALGTFVGPSNGKNVTLTVKNPDLSSATWTITAPKITSTAPSNGVPIGESVNRTLTGSGFVTGSGGTTFSGFTGAAGGMNISCASSTSCTLTGIQATGAVNTNVVVPIYNPDGSSTSATYLIDALPAATSENPSTFLIGPTKTISVTGSGFLSGVTVSSVSVPGGGSAGLGSTAYSSPTSLSFTMTPTVAGNYTFSINNTDGGTSVSTFTIVVTGPPTFTSISPSTFVGTNVNNTFTIVGTGIKTGATVQLATGTQPGTMTVSSTVVSPTTGITLTAKFSATGTYKLVIVNLDGGTSSTVNLVISALPVVTGVSPTSWAINVSKQYTLTGSNMVTGATVQKVSGCGTISPTSTPAINSSGQFTASFSAAGPCVLQLVNPDGGTSGNFTITVNPLPHETSFTLLPAMTKNTNSTVTVTGTGLQNGATISVVSGPGGGNLGASTTTATNGPGTTTTFTINPSKVGTYTIQITNPDGGVSTSWTLS